MDITINTAQNVGITYKPAGLMPRIIATVIDLALLGGVFILGSAILLNLYPRASWFPYTLLVTLLSFYHLVCEYFFNGQSIGKATLPQTFLLGLLVAVGAPPGGHQLQFRRHRHGLHHPHFQSPTLRRPGGKHHRHPGESPEGLAPRFPSDRRNAPPIPASSHTLRPGHQHHPRSLPRGRENRRPPALCPLGCQNQNHYRHPNRLGRPRFHPHHPDRLHQNN